MGGRPSGKDSSQARAAISHGCGGREEEKVGGGAARGAGGLGGVAGVAVAVAGDALCRRVRRDPLAAQREIHHGDFFGRGGKQCGGGSGRAHDGYDDRTAPDGTNDAVLSPPSADIGSSFCRACT